MRSRAFHDTSGTTGPSDRISGFSSTGLAKGHGGRTGRRDSAFRLAEHSVNKHGEERSVSL